MRDATPRDPSSIGRPAEDLLQSSLRKQKKVRLGWPKEYFWTQVDPQVHRLAEAAVEGLIKLGAEVQEISLPTLPATVEPSNIIALVEARQYHQAMGYFPLRRRSTAKTCACGLLREATCSRVDYLLAREIIRRSRAEFVAALHNVQAIVAPASPIPAPLIGSERVRVGDAEEMVRSALVRLNRPSNFTGLPAISVPCGFTNEGLPVGLQLIGREFEEGALLGHCAHVRAGT